MLILYYTAIYCEPIDCGGLQEKHLFKVFFLLIIRIKKKVKKILKKLEKVHKKC